MRNIINISLPPELKRDVDKAVKTGRFSTKSEFFRHLMRLWQEEQLLAELRQSQKEIVLGRGKKLKSLKSLR